MLSTIGMFLNYNNLNCCRDISLSILILTFLLKGAEKVSLPHLNDTSLWKTSGRLDMPELFRLRDRTERSYILAPVLLIR